MRKSSGHFVQRHPSGARVVLCDASEGADMAIAIATMLAPVTGHRVRNRVRLAKTTGPCVCGDCLSCEIQESRRLHYGATT